MTRVFHKHLYPETSIVCTLCSGDEEECAHLCFECPFARMIWNRQTISRVDNLGDVLLRVNPEEWWQKKRGRGSNTRGALGNMVALE